MRYLVLGELEEQTTTDNRTTPDTRNPDRPAESKAGDNATKEIEVMLGGDRSRSEGEGAAVCRRGRGHGSARNNKFLDVNGSRLFLSLGLGRSRHRAD